MPKFKSKDRKRNIKQFCKNEMKKYRESERIRTARGEMTREEIIQAFLLANIKMIETKIK